MPKALRVLNKVPHVPWRTIQYNTTLRQSCPAPHWSLSSASPWECTAHTPQHERTSDRAIAWQRRGGWASPVDAHAPDTRTISSTLTARGDKQQFTHALSTRPAAAHERHLDPRCMQHASAGVHSAPVTTERRTSTGPTPPSRAASPSRTRLRVP